MTEKEIRAEYEEVRAELEDVRNRLITIRQTYEQLESITNYIKGLQAA